MRVVLSSRGVQRVLSVRSGGYHSGLLTVIALATIGAFLSVGVASAQDYIPPGVTSSVVATSSSVAVAPTSSGIAGQSLSYTGTGFDVGGVVTNGAIVIVLGVGLCTVGARLSKRRTSQH